MRQVTLYFLGIVALCVAACASGRQASVPSLWGEWDIVEVRGAAVDTARVNTKPFIGFEAAEKRVYGCASCNHFFGNLQVDTVRQTLRLEQVGATKMACHYMDVETAVLEALYWVAAYAPHANGELQLLDAAGKPLLLLRKREVARNVQ